jgi:hypothetical protein
LPNADQPDFIAILGLNYSENFKLPEEKPLETATSTNAWAATTVNVFSTSTNPINE